MAASRTCHGFGSHHLCPRVIVELDIVDEQEPDLVGDLGQELGSLLDQRRQFDEAAPLLRSQVAPETLPRRTGVPSSGTRRAGERPNVLTVHPVELGQIENGRILRHCRTIRIARPPARAGKPSGPPRATIPTGTGSCRGPRGGNRPRDTRSPPWLRAAWRVACRRCRGSTECGRRSGTSSTKGERQLDVTRRRGKQVLAPGHMSDLIVDVVDG